MTVEHVAVLVGTGVVSFLLSYLGAACGLILGHLRLPLLVYALANPVAGAATNLAVSGLGAVAGSVKHVRDGRVSVPLLLLMGVPSVAGSVLAVLFFASVNVFWSHLLIGLMLVYSGYELLKHRKDDTTAAGVPKKWVVPTEIGVGLGLGALAAATGLMLGTIRLPLMIRWMKVDPKVAVGTNMLVGCLTAFAAAATAGLRGGVLDPLALAIVAPPTVLGSYYGARLTGKLSPQKLKAFVGWTVAFTGLFMAGQAGQLKLRRWLSPPGAHVPVIAFDPLEDTPDPGDEDPFDWRDWDDDSDERKDLQPLPGPDPQLEPAE